MKLIVTKQGAEPRTIEGAEAKAVLREVFQSIGQSILMPEMPYTGRIRCRAKRRLQQGEHIWTHPDRNGQVTARSTILRMPLEPLTIVGIIDATGAYQEVAESGVKDPRLGKACEPSDNKS